MKNLINIQNMKLKKGTLLFLLLAGLAYTTLAQTSHTLQYEDVTINENGMITECTCTFSANTKGIKLIIPKSVTKGSETITIKGIYDTYPGIFQEKNLGSVTFTNDSEVKVIGNQAFQSNNITELTLPASLTIIERWAFYGNKITTLTFPEGSQLETIEKNAFKNNKITTLSLPPSLTIIRESAFEDNSLPTSVIFNGASNIKSIGKNAFSGNDKLTAITLPEHAEGDKVTYKDSDGTPYSPGGAFTNFDKSITTVYPLYTLTADDVDVDGKGIITKCYCTFVSNRITIPVQIGTEIITGIGNSAFINKNLAAVIFAEGSKVVSIRNNAFQNNFITTLTLPENLTTIGNGAFEPYITGDNKIETLTLPENLTTIGNNAFYGTEIGGTLALPENLTTIGNNAFQNNNITTLTIPNDAQLTTIGSSAFQDNNITTLTIPNDAQLTTIGSSAFQNNKITTLTIPNDTQLTTIESNAFQDNKITTLTIPNDALTTIGNGAFQNNKITTLTIPNDAQLTTIGSGAFQNNNITTLTIPNDAQLTTIGSGAFQDNNITTLTIPNDTQLTTIGSSAFQNNNITTLTLPASLVIIRESAFYNNSLTRVTFNGASNIKSIGKDAFSGNNQLTGITLPEHADKTVTYSITYKDGINDYNSGEDFSNFDRSLITVFPYYTLTSNDVTVVDGIITECYCENFVSNRIIIPIKIGEKTITGIGKRAFIEKNLAAVTFAERSKVISIYHYAFKNNIIETLTLPTTLTTIEYMAFENNQIATLTLPTTLTTIRDYAFKDNIIEALTLPTILNTIGNYAFYGNKIKTLSLPASLMTIGESAFRKNQLIEVTFKVEPNKSQIRSIGKDTFSENTNELKNKGITLPEHAEGTDVTYKDSDDQVYNPMDIFTNFSKSLAIVFPYYTLTSNDVTVVDGIITECFCGNFVSDKIIIPVQIGEKTITGIGSKAFDGKYLGAVTFAEESKVISIGNEAFQNNSITALTLPTTLTTIGTWAFFDNKIKTLTLPASLTTIGSYAFYNTNFNSNNSIVTLSLPDSLTTIGNFAFYRHKITVLSLPASLMTIGSYAFQENQLIEVTFKVEPNKSQIRSIGKDAFWDNAGLTAITLPEHVEGDEVTYKDSDDNPYSPGGTFTHFDKSITTVYPLYTLTADDVDVDDKGIITKCYCTFFSKKIIIPIQIGEKTIKGVGNEAFKNKNLDSVTFEDGSKIISIGDEAFRNNHITALALPTTLTTIGQSAFSDNSLLQSFTLPMATIDGVSTYWEGGNSVNLGINPTIPKEDFEKSYKLIYISQITLKLDIKGEGSTTPGKGENIYEKGTTATLKAEPADGWRFDKWVIVGEDNNDNPTTITLDKNKSVTAHFVKKEEEEKAITGILTEVVSATPYPNPVTSQITLKAKDGDLIQLFSSKGKLQYSTQHTGNEVHTIDVSAIPVGVYLVRITDAEGNTTTKRIVKK